MDKLLSKNNVWLKDHGTYRGQPTNDARNLLLESKQNLRPAEAYSYHATTPSSSNNNNDNLTQQPSSLFKRQGNENNGESAPLGKQFGEPFKRRFPKEHVFEVSDDFR